MDAAAHHLQKIVLRGHKTASSTPSDASFFGLVTFLSQEYGPPSAHNDTLKFESLVRSRTWTFPTTIIELRYARSRLFSALTLTYMPARR